MKARDWPAFAWIEIVETHIRKISSGQRRPASRIARSDPSAIMSLSAQTAVGRGIGFSSVSVFEWPPRLSNVVSCTYPGRRGSLDSRIARLKPLSLSFAFVRWNGPVMVANFLCPSRIKTAGRIVRSLLIICRDAITFPVSGKPVHTHHAGARFRGTFLRAVRSLKLEGMTIRPAGE